MSAPAHAASAPHAAGQISPLPRALAPMAAGSAPGTARSSRRAQFAEHAEAFDRVAGDGAHRHHQPSAMGGRNGCLPSAGRRARD